MFVELFAFLCLYFETVMATAFALFRGVRGNWTLSRFLRPSKTASLGLR